MFDETYDYAMDMNYWVRMAEAGVAPKLIRQFIAGHRTHEQQKTTTMTDVGASEVARILIQFHGPEFLWRAMQRSKLTKHCKQLGMMVPPSLESWPPSLD